MHLVARVHAAHAQEPRDQSFDVPAPPVPPERSAVLRFLVGRVVRRDELDAALLEPRVERVAVVRLVADESLGEGSGETAGDGVFDAADFRSRTTFNPCGERKTSAV